MKHGQQLQTQMSCLLNYQSQTGGSHLTHLVRCYLQSVAKSPENTVCVFIRHVECGRGQSVPECMSVHPPVCVKYGPTVRNQGMSLLRQTSCLSLLYTQTETEEAAVVFHTDAWHRGKKIEKIEGEMSGGKEKRKW